MTQLGFSHRLIPSDADFIKLAIKYDLILAATLFSLWMIVLVQTGLPKLMFDYHNFKLSEATFRETMRYLAMMMTSVSVNWYVPFNRIIYASLYVALLGGNKAIDIRRIDKEMVMLCGFLALVFLLMNLFGFFLGVLCLLVSSPFLFLVQEFIKFRKLKESRG
ncbi:hypothetical protein CARUB_v10019140mg [Capsella rubella]|uniref:Uncharacterized protein n=1 Tax=Capsella rubella TaxID=81985 RepID=R0FSG2_9BRAS|nr:hypothetical protein CARUB_v10019140mg [Capsella rubella]